MKRRKGRKKINVNNKKWQKMLIKNLNTTIALIQSPIPEFYTGKYLFSSSFEGDVFIFGSWEVAAGNFF